MHARLKMMPTNNPMSIENMTTVKNVTIQTAASNRLSFQKSKNSFVCISIPLSATTTTLARTHYAIENKKLTQLLHAATAKWWSRSQLQKTLTFGNSSKNGPIQSKTNVRIPHEISEAICVLPPVVCCMAERDSDAANGIHEKNEPTTLPEPIANSSWLKSIS